MPTRWLFLLGFLVPAFAVAGAAWSPLAAADTTIKCSCACQDKSGTWKGSCYSMGSCETCCGYAGSWTASNLSNVVLPERTEGAQGRLVPLKDARRPDSRLAAACDAYSLPGSHLMMPMAFSRTSNALSLNIPNNAATNATASGLGPPKTVCTLPGSWAAPTTSRA